MSIIAVLPELLRNKIAAGEVVERPASVVKELVENALDAGSTRISVEIVRAGKRLIHVSDNGAGMDRDDAVRCFERYATSKISEERDLFNLRSMGFRGEALSSIAAVSKVVLMTAVRAEGRPELGTSIEIVGGEIRSVKDCAASGTSIEVRDLFFNVPARRKFQKSDPTENYHIIDSVTRAALSSNHISFVLIIDGIEVFNLPAAHSRRERLVQLFGMDFAGGLLEYSSSDHSISAAIFTSGLAHMKNNRSSQYIFVNSRPVKDQSVSYAVYKAYEGMAPKEKHPAFLLFIDIDPGQVDFNVHPAKREIRFAKKDAVFDLVFQAAKAALKQDSGWTVEERTGTDASFDLPRSVPFPVSSSGDLISEKLETFTTGYRSFIYLGETFIAVPDGSGLVLLDYHAAHERVNYERFLRRMDIETHRLLFPEQVGLPHGEYAMMLEKLELLREVGFDIDDFGHDTLIVRGIPDMMMDADIGSLIKDVASSLAGPAGGLEPVESVRKRIAARLACHSSIRGKETPDGPRIAELMKSLDAAENPNSCPHGRPTKIVISLAELRKMFKK